MTPALRLAVLVASRGRAQELAELLEGLATQTEPAEQIILSVTNTNDLPGRLTRGVETVHGLPGLCRQRNAAMDLVRPDIDLLAFLDDDYLPSRTALADVRRYFCRHGDVVAANGLLLADGVNGPGLSFQAARDLIAQFDDAPRSVAYTIDGWATYGCNMVFRAAVARSKRFDEELPLYGWQEDIDFSSPLIHSGRIVSTNAFAGVHRGVKSARVSGVRFGYSQISNPIYLARKGTMPSRYALKVASKNVVANAVRSIFPEPWVDRRGRLWGNLLALVDSLCGRLNPARIIDL